MANTLKMEQILAIRALLDSGWSERRISRELGLHRNTVRRYIRVEGAGAGEARSSVVDTGIGVAKCTISQTGKQGRRSGCERYREQIEGKYIAGLSVERIHQDLRQEQGFTGSYHSVWRYVEGLGISQEKRVHRMEVEPGQEAQVDFGTMYLLEGSKGRLRKVSLLLVSLSHSRKGYAEAMVNEKSENFLRGLENAFLHFGGVPQRLCTDNLAAAVKQADWYDPVINPKLASFARHYGTVVMPARPYRPTDKGKVESGIKYLKNNALKGHRFESIAAINAHLQQWTEKVSDLRIHGTTKQQVREHFLESEKAALLPLPEGLFPSFQEARRSVHRDSYVEVARSYYEVPAEYVGHVVWVRWDGRMVRVFDRGMRMVAIHRRLDKAGQFSRVLGVAGCPGPVQESLLYYRGRVGKLSKVLGAWADGTIADDPDRALRRLQGLLGLYKSHPMADLERAAAKALLHGHFQLKQLKNWLSSPQQQEVFAFLEQHDLIREPGDYTRLSGTAGLFDN